MTSRILAVCCLLGWVLALPVSGATLEELWLQETRQEISVPSVPDPDPALFELVELLLTQAPPTEELELLLGRTGCRLETSRDGFTVLRPGNPAEGYLLAFRSAPGRTMLCAPHGIFDTGSGSVAIRLFRQTPSARCLLLNTLHRKVLDVAHQPESRFQQVFGASLEEITTAIQVHGFGPGRPELAGTDMVASYGLRADLGHPVVECLRTELELRLYPLETRQFGALTNVQKDAVYQRGGGRAFLHLELSEPMRELLLRDPESIRRLADCLDQGASWKAPEGEGRPSGPSIPEEPDRAFAPAAGAGLYGLSWRPVELALWGRPEGGPPEREQGGGELPVPAGATWVQVFLAPGSTLRTGPNLSQAHCWVAEPGQPVWLEATPEVTETGLYLDNLTRSTQAVRIDLPPGVRRIALHRLVQHPNALGWTTELDRLLQEDPRTPRELCRSLWQVRRALLAASLVPGICRSVLLEDDLPPPGGRLHLRRGSTLEERFHRPAGRFEKLPVAPAGSLGTPRMSREVELVGPAVLAVTSALDPSHLESPTSGERVSYLISLVQDGAVMDQAICSSRISRQELPDRGGITVPEERRFFIPPGRHRIQVRFPIPAHVRLELHRPRERFIPRGALGRLYHLARGRAGMGNPAGEHLAWLTWTPRTDGPLPLLLAPVPDRPSLLAAGSEPVSMEGLVDPEQPPAWLRLEGHVRALIRAGLDRRAGRAALDTLPLLPETERSWHLLPTVSRLYRAGLPAETILGEVHSGVPRLPDALRRLQRDAAAHSNWHRVEPQELGDHPLRPVWVDRSSFLPQPPPGSALLLEPGRRYHRSAPGEEPLELWIRGASDREIPLEIETGAEIHRRTAHPGFQLLVLPDASPELVVRWEGPLDVLCPDAFQPEDAPVLDGGYRYRDRWITARLAPDHPLEYRLPERPLQSVRLRLWSEDNAPAELLLEGAGPPIRVRFEGTGSTQISLPPGVDGLRLQSRAGTVQLELAVQAIHPAGCIPELPVEALQAPAEPWQRPDRPKVEEQLQALGAAWEMTDPVERSLAVGLALRRLERIPLALGLLASATREAQDPEDRARLILEAGRTLRDGGSTWMAPFLVSDLADTRVVEEALEEAAAMEIGSGDLRTGLRYLAALWQRGTWNPRAAELARVARHARRAGPGPELSTEELARGSALPGSLSREALEEASSCLGLPVEALRLGRFLPLPAEAIRRNRGRSTQLRPAGGYLGTTALPAMEMLELQGNPLGLDLQGPALLRLSLRAPLELAEPVPVSLKLVAGGLPRAEAELIFQPSYYWETAREGDPVSRLRRLYLCVPPGPHRLEIVSDKTVLCSPSIYRPAQGALARWSPEPPTPISTGWSLLSGQTASYSDLPEELQGLRARINGYRDRAAQDDPSGLREEGVALLVELAALEPRWPDDPMLRLLGERIMGGLVWQPIRRAESSAGSWRSALDPEPLLSLPARLRRLLAGSPFGEDPVRLLDPERPATLEGGPLRQAADLVVQIQVAEFADPARTGPVTLEIRTTVNGGASYSVTVAVPVGPAETIPLVRVPPGDRFSVTASVVDHPRSALGRAIWLRLARTGADGDVIPLEPSLKEYFTARSDRPVVLSKFGPTVLRLKAIGVDQARGIRIETDGGVRELFLKHPGTDGTGLLETLIPLEGEGRQRVTIHPLGSGEVRLRAYYPQQAPESLQDAFPARDLPRAPLAAFWPRPPRTGSLRLTTPVWLSSAEDPLDRSWDTGLELRLGHGDEIPEGGGEPTLRTGGDLTGWWQGPLLSGKARLRATGGTATDRSGTAAGLDTRWERRWGGRFLAGLESRAWFQDAPGNPRHLQLTLNLDREIHLGVDTTLIPHLEWFIRDLSLTPTEADALEPDSLDQRVYSPFKASHGNGLTGGIDLVAYPVPRTLLLVKTELLWREDLAGYDRTQWRIGGYRYLSGPDLELGVEANGLHGPVTPDRPEARNRYTGSLQLEKGVWTSRGDRASAGLELGLWSEAVDGRSEQGFRTELRLRWTFRAAGSLSRSLRRSERFRREKEFRFRRPEEEP